MKEVYRSFDGMLGVENQRGYIIKEGKDYYEIQFLSVWTDETDDKIRISKSVKFDFADYEEICRLWFEVEHGVTEGQAFFRGKWYSTPKINKIQEDREDGNWKRYV